MSVRKPRKDAKKDAARERTGLGHELEVGKSGKFSNCGHKWLRQTLKRLSRGDWEAVVCRRVTTLQNLLFLLGKTARRHVKPRRGESGLLLPFGEADQASSLSMARFDIGA